MVASSAVRRACHLAKPLGLLVLRSVMAPSLPRLRRQSAGSLMSLCCDWAWCARRVWWCCVWCDTDCGENANSFLWDANK